MASGRLTDGPSHKVSPYPLWGRYHCIHCSAVPFPQQPREPRFCASPPAPTMRSTPLMPTVMGLHPSMNNDNNTAPKCTQNPETHA